MLHGTLVGGALAGFLHCDFACSDQAATFEHGNLVRGVNPLGMLSQTLPAAVGGMQTLQMYFMDPKLTATQAKHLGLVQEVCQGISLAMRRATALGQCISPVDCSLVISLRMPISRGVLDEEAVGHAECLRFNKGMTKNKPGALASMPQIHWLDVVGVECPRISLDCVPFASVDFFVPELIGNGAMAPEVDVLQTKTVIFSGAGDNFCLGGDPSGSKLTDGSFLDGLEPFARLHAALQEAALPSIAVCNGATRGGGMRTCHL